MAGEGTLSADNHGHLEGWRARFKDYKSPINYGEIIYEVRIINFFYYLEHAISQRKPSRLAKVNPDHP